GPVPSVAAADFASRRADVASAKQVVALAIAAYAAHRCHALLPRDEAAVSRAAADAVLRAPRGVLRGGLADRGQEREWDGQRKSECRAHGYLGGRAAGWYSALGRRNGLGAQVPPLPLDAALHLANVTVAR